MQTFLETVVAEGEQVAVPFTNYTSPIKYTAAFRERHELTQRELNEDSKIAAEILFSQEIGMWLKDVARRQASIAIKLPVDSQ